MLSCAVEVMRVGEVGWPGALDDVLGAAAFHHDFVGQPTALGQDEQVERVVEVVVVHGRILGRVRRFQRHGSLGSRREQLGDQGEGGLVIERHAIVQMGGTAVALRVEELDVRLLWCLAHGVMSRSTRSGVPEGGFRQTVIEPGKGKRSERKG